MAKIRSNKPVVISDSGLNSQGFRMLTEGALLDEFDKNPLLLFNHIRPKGNKKNQILPIGNIEDWKVEGDVISGYPSFDDDDDFSMSIYKKWESGTLRMASAGAEPLETSDEPEYLLPGQKLSTVTKWRLKEVSICDIGANPNALAIALYDHAGKMITLSESGIKTIPTSIKPTMKQNKKTAAELVKAKMIELSATLKTELKDSDEKVVTALEKHLIKLADDCATKMSSENPETALADEAPAPDDKDAIIADLKKQIEELQKKLNGTAPVAAADEDPEKMLADEPTDNDKAVKLAAAALKLGKIRLNEVQSTITLATSDYDGTVKMLKAKKAEPTVKSQLESLTSGAEDRVIELSKKPWDDLFKKTGDLEFLKLNAPDVFKAKYEAKFGKKPKNL